MKKSQVLAALALALALGVAAPVASTYAAYGGSPAQQAESEKAVDDVMESVEALPNYTGYHAIYTAIKTLDAALENGEKAALAELRDQLNNISNINDIKGSVNIDSTSYTYASLTSVVNGWIKTQEQIVQKAESADATQPQKDAAAAAQTNIVALEAAKDAAETEGGFADAYDAAVTAIITNGKSDDGKDLFNTSDIVATDGKYTAEDYEKVEKRATASPYGTYADLFKLTDVAEDMQLKATEPIYSPSTVASLVSQIEAAVAQIESGDFETPVTPDEPADEEKPTTPDTGVNTASEASATASVSILSGLASVATAAGVVIRKAFRK